MCLTSATDTGATGHPGTPEEAVNSLSAVLDTCARNVVDHLHHPEANVSCASGLVGGVSKDQRAEAIDFSQLTAEPTTPGIEVLLPDFTSSAVCFQQDQTAPLDTSRATASMSKPASKLEGLRSASKVTKKIYSPSSLVIDFANGTSMKISSGWQQRSCVWAGAFEEYHETGS